MSDSSQTLNLNKSSSHQTFGMIAKSLLYTDADITYKVLHGLNSKTFIKTTDRITKLTNVVERGRRPKRGWIVYYNDTGLFVSHSQASVVFINRQDKVLAT